MHLAEGVEIATFTNHAGRSSGARFRYWGFGMLLLLTNNLQSGALIFNSDAACGTSQNSLLLVESHDFSMVFLDKDYIPQSAVGTDSVPKVPRKEPASVTSSRSSSMRCIYRSRPLLYKPSMLLGNFLYWILLYFVFKKNVKAFSASILTW
jgi:hypothetical protein